MKKSDITEICVLSIIFKHPKTGFYLSAVGYDSRQTFKDSIRDLESRNIEIIFKCCESKSDLFELGLTLHEGFVGTDLNLKIEVARINKKLAKSSEKNALSSRTMPIPKIICYAIDQVYPSPSVASAP
ncbi:MAG: hypothetical protein ACD_9C00336G0002 [uncultured bacterium]|nr:MAG: hypothetical protein ACD_9C00336G0002 [uncultured bacterium]